MGVYPLLRNATCWFLAVDFDKTSWKEDVASFIETCRIMGIPCGLERSRSGNGAHAWFFFASPIPSAVARKMGSHLLTETMTRRHQLSMNSYDRLFPNQDTMPRGGLGNLIALPLQYEARRHGNTVFVDAGFEPYLDQWAYLASVRRLEPENVEAIARAAERRDAVVGVRIAEPMDDEGTKPWRQLPMGNSGNTPANNVVHIANVIYREFPLAAPLPAIETVAGDPRTMSVFTVPPAGMLIWGVVTVSLKSSDCLRAIRR